MSSFRILYFMNFSSESTSEIKYNVFTNLSQATVLVYLVNLFFIPIFFGNLSIFTHRHIL